MKDRSRAAVRELSNTRKSFASLMSRTGVVKPDSDSICVVLSQQAARVRIEVAKRVWLLFVLSHLFVSSKAGGVFPKTKVVRKVFPIYSSVTQLFSREVVGRQPNQMRQAFLLIRPCLSWRLKEVLERLPKLTVNGYGAIQPKRPDLGGREEEVKRLFL